MDVNKEDIIIFFSALCYFFENLSSGTCPDDRQRGTSLPPELKKELHLRSAIPLSKPEKDFFQWTLLTTWL